jgi:hypothetical protein
MSIALAPIAVAVLTALAPACGTSAVGVQACRSIETARCEAAPACKLALSPPVYIGDAVTACVRFYDDQCLHGLVTTLTPTTLEVNQCVAAINAAGAAAAKGNLAFCGTVSEPGQNLTACGFLNPVDAGEDSGTDAGQDADDDAG